MWCMEFITQVLEEFRRQRGTVRQPKMSHSWNPLPSWSFWGKWEEVCYQSPGPGSHGTTANLPRSQRNMGDPVAHVDTEAQLVDPVWSGGGEVEGRVPFFLSFSPSSLILILRLAEFIYISVHGGIWSLQHPWLFHRERTQLDLRENRSGPARDCHVRYSLLLRAGDYTKYFASPVSSNFPHRPRRYTLLSEKTVLEQVRTSSTHTACKRLSQDLSSCLSVCPVWVLSTR